MRAKRHPTRGENLRRALAQEAARIMAEHGIRDFLVAKRKAAERFGVSDGTAVLPRNSEIEEALAAYQRLFGGDSHLQALHAQRSAALAAMRYLHEFEPRLVGAVLSGTATEHSEVQLHLFADRAESVTLKLIDQGIPHEVTERRVKLNAERSRAFPGVRFEMDDQPIEATVFPPDGIRQAPVSPVDGRPMRRASALEVEALLAATLTGTRARAASRAQAFAIVIARALLTRKEHHAYRAASAVPLLGDVFYVGGERARWPVRQRGPRKARTGATHGDTGPDALGQRGPGLCDSAAPAATSHRSISANPIPKPLSPIGFDYRPIPLTVTDTGHTMQVNVPPGSGGITVGDGPLRAGAVPLPPAQRGKHPRQALRRWWRTWCTRTPKGSWRSWPC